MRRISAFLSRFDDWLGRQAGDTLGGRLDLPPIGIGGRVEVLRYGFALTLPPEWAWVRPSALDAAPFMRSLEVAMDREDAAKYLQIAAAMREPDPEPLWAYRGDVRGDDSPGESLAVSLWPPPDDRGLEAVVSGFDEFVQAQQGVDPGRTTVTPLLLPAGDAFRLDYRHALEGASADYAQYFIAGDVMYALLFIAGEPPEDRWLSIAETFELLPDKG